MHVPKKNLQFYTSSAQMIGILLLFLRYFLLHRSSFLKEAFSSQQASLVFGLHNIWFIFIIFSVCIQNCIESCNTQAHAFVTKSQMYCIQVSIHTPLFIPSTRTPYIILCVYAYTMVCSLDFAFLRLFFFCSEKCSIWQNNFCGVYSSSIRSSLVYWFKGGGIAVPTFQHAHIAL